MKLIVLYLNNEPTLPGCQALMGNWTGAATCGVPVVGMLAVDLGGSAAPLGVHLCQWHADQVAL